MMNKIRGGKKKEKRKLYFLPIAKARIVEWFRVKKYLFPASSFQSSLSETCSYPALLNRFFASSKNKNVLTKKLIAHPKKHHSRKGVWEEYKGTFNFISLLADFLLSQATYRLKRESSYQRRGKRLGKRSRSRWNRRPLRLLRCVLLPWPWLIRASQQACFV